MARERHRGFESQRLRSEGLIRPSGAEHVAIGFWRNPGDDLEIETSGRHHRPTQTNALTCVFGTVSRSAIFQGLIRDEEAAGSNPATPTGKRQVTRHLVACRLRYAFLGARFWEPIGKRQQDDPACRMGVVTEFSPYRRGHAAKGARLKVQPILVTAGRETMWR